MESQRASKTKRNIFARAAHKVSKRLSKLFTRRNRQGESNMSVSNQNVRENTSTRSTSTITKVSREKEMILDEFLEKLPEKKGLYRVLNSETVRKFMNNNPDNKYVILLYSFAESYNKTPNEGIKQLIQNMTSRIMTSRIMKEIKALKMNNFNHQLSISQRMVLKKENNRNTAAYEAELAELLEKSSPQSQKGGMKQKMKKWKSSKMSKTLKKSKKSRC